MADEAELFCTSASKTVVFARLLVSVNDLHRGLSSSVFRVEQITQNPPLATAYRFESGHRHQKRDIREDVSFFAADRMGYTNLVKITNISIAA